MPICEIIVPHTRENEDTDHKDFVILKIDLNKIDNNEQFFSIYDLNKFHNFKPIHSDRILISGFPSEINTIDYNEKRIKIRRFLIAGTKLGNVDYIGMVKFAYDPQDKIKDFNGMSGSPVFIFSPQTDKKVVAKLEGLLLRQNYYLDFSIIYMALQML